MQRVSPNPPGEDVNRAFHLLFIDPIVIRLLQLRPVEKNILELVRFKQQTFEEIAPQFGVDAEVVKEIYEQAGSIINENFINILDRLKAIDALEEENKELKRELEVLYK